LVVKFLLPLEIWETCNPCELRVFHQAYELFGICPFFFLFGLLDSTFSDFLYMAETLKGISWLVKSQKRSAIVLHYSICNILLSVW
jgi:hypothetical protein